MLRAFLADRTAPLRALLISAFLAACADHGADQQALADSALARDLALVQSAGTVQPIFRDTALTNTPAPRSQSAAPREPVARPSSQSTRERAVATTRRPRQQARPGTQRETQRPTRTAEVPPPEPEAPAAQPAQPTERSGDSGRGAIGAGTVLAASSNARVCTRSNLPGDRITATVNAPVRGTSGAEIPAGAKVVLEVVSVNGGDSSDEGQVVFRVNSVAIGDESYPASGDATASGRLEHVAGPRNASSDKKKVIGGAIAGAILGQMMGRDTRSTVIGAAAGAAAGTAAARMGDRGESCLAAGARVRITLDEVVMH
jgi:YmgG-like glycine-zipper protein